MRFKESFRKLCLTVIIFAMCLSLVSIGAGASESQHEHQWQEIKRTEPTCEDFGESVRRCVLCSREETVTLPRLGHRFDVPEADKEYPLFGTVRRYCSRCEKYIYYKKGAYNEPPIEQPSPPFEAENFNIKDEKQLQALGVSTSETEDYYRWYYGEGLQILTDSYTPFDPERPQFCEYNHYDPSGRGYIQNGHLCPKFGHSATCTEWGFDMYLPCWKCGRTAFEIDGTEDFWYTNPPTGHDFNVGYSYVSPAPTCTEDGVLIIPCNNNCGEQITEIEPAYGHNYIYEKSYYDNDEKLVQGKVYCEQGDDERSATIAGSVWKDSYRVGIVPYQKFKITFTNESGKVTEAEYLTSSYHGYFAELPTGKYTLTASAEGFDDRTYYVTVEKGKLLDFDVFMDKDGDITDIGTESKISLKTDSKEGESNSGSPIVPIAAAAVGLAGAGAGITFAIKRKGKK